MENQELTVLKTDGRGRVRRSVAEREAILDEFERSGVPARPFAEMHGINYQTLHSWIVKRRERKASGAVEGVGQAPVRFVEAVMGTRGGLRVELPGGAILVIEDESQARLAGKLIKSLSVVEARAC